MQPNIKHILFAFTFLMVVSCETKSDSQKQIQKKQEQIEKLKKQQSEISSKIDKLEKELIELDPTLKKEEKPKLVNIQPISIQPFVHEIELQGKIEAENTAYVAPPNGQGGVVTRLYVKQGDRVSKGQTLLQLDPMTLRQQIEPLKVQLATAKDVYNRRQNLWKQGIGSEVELISARTQVESLEKNIATLQKQISLFTVRAPESGVVDILNIRPGEMFTGSGVGGPQIRIVNTSKLKAVAQVPENYTGQVNVGNPVTVYFPNINKTVKAKVTVAGKQIDPLSRSFYIEANLPASSDFKPNQVAVVGIQDYTAPNAISIPLPTLQNDDKGKYVMVAVNQNNKLIAKKKYVETGLLFKDNIEIKSGLEAGDQLITEGFQNLYDGQLLTTTK